MYNDSKNILTSVICLLVIAAVAIGALFACGVIKTPTKTKLPISYPDKTINWMSLDDGKTLRAAFNDKLNLNKDKQLQLIVNINNLFKENAELGFNCRNDRSSETLGYDIWSSTGVGDVYVFCFDNAEGVSVGCKLIFCIYNGATLTDAGEVTTGSGFVIELGNFQVEDTSVGDGTFKDVKIESAKIVSMYQDTVNKLLK